MTMKLGGGFKGFGNPFKGSNAKNKGGSFRGIGPVRKTTKFLGGWFTNNNAGGNGGNKKPPTKLGASDDDDEDEDKGLWQKYESALEARPLLVKGLTSFTGFTIGDLLAQFFIEKKEYDPLRTLRLASFGFLVHGTTSHWFYGILDGRIPGTGAGDVALKVFIDQVLWNPIFGIMFFSYMGIFEGSGVGGTIQKIKNDLLTQVTGSWTVWPIAHAINFKYIPSDQRVLYINTIQIFYNCFLSVIGSRKPDTA